MMDFMKKWTLAVFTAAIISSIVCEISPKGKTHAAVKFVCGLMTLLCILTPLTQAELDLDAIAGSFAREKQSISEKIAGDTQSATRKVIQEKFEAYIMDKGKNFGIADIHAHVTLRWSEEGYWYPESAEIISEADTALLDMLCDVLRSELGDIPVTRSKP